MTNTSPSFVKTLETLLPSNQHSLTKTLIKLIWARPDGRYLLAATTRLRKLITEQGMNFPDIVLSSLSQSEIDHWISQVQKCNQSIKNEDQRRDIDEILANPLTEAISKKGKHVNRGYLTTFPVYTALLTTRDEDIYKSIHEKLTTWYVGHAMAHLTDLSWEDYLNYIKSPLVNNIPHGSSQFKASLAIRTMQSNMPSRVVWEKLSLITDKYDIHEIRKAISHDIEQESVNCHLGYLESFLLERYRDQPTIRKKTVSTTFRGSYPQPAFPKVNSDALTTFLSISTNETIDPKITSEPDWLVSIATPEDIQLAEGLDLALIEVIDSPPLFIDQLDTLDQAPDEESLNVYTRNRYQFVRRLNQFQRWRSGYVSKDTWLELINRLKSIIIAETSKAPDNKVMGKKEIAALLMLIGIVTGRSAKNLINQFEVLTNSSSIPAHQSNVIYQKEDDFLAVRTNRAPTQAIVTAQSRPVSDWLAIPDFLHLGNCLKFYTAGRNEYSEIDLVTAVDTLENEELKPRGISLAKLAELLPRHLLEVTGHYSSTVLITDWDKANSTVDLHYLTPEATSIYSRYVSAMRTLLNLEESPDITTQIKRLVPKGYIGMPNTPDWAALEDTIQALRNIIKNGSRTRQECHNAYTLYIIMMATFSLGLRHTISIDIGKRQMGDLNIGYFREKGADRLLVIPPRLNEQLRHYEKHFRGVMSWNGISSQISKIGSPQFFLLDSESKPTLFHPTRFNDYLAELEIEFTLPLNSLRRSVFSELVDLGLRGIVTDHYIGHAAQGREPLVHDSGFKIQTLVDLSDEIEILLKRHNWESIKGPFHG